jgi:hypothetical protein
MTAEWEPKYPCTECKVPLAAPDCMDECCCELKLEYVTGRAYQQKLLKYLIAFAKTYPQQIIGWYEAITKEHLESMLKDSEEGK